MLKHHQKFSLKKLLETAVKKPRAIILDNSYTITAGLLATIAPSFVAVISPYAVFGVGAISIIILLVGIITEAKKYQIYTQENLPLPIVINISNPHNENDALNSLFTLIQKQPIYNNYKKDIEKYLGITSQDLVHKYNGDIFDTPRLISFLQITKKLIEKVKEKTPQDSTIYLAYIGPISVAWLIGAMLQREGMIIFQRNQATNSYESVITVKDRELKEKITHLEKFTQTKLIANNNTGKLTVAIDTASHKIKLNNPEIKDYGDLISLENTNSNTIEFREIWLDYVREISHILNEEQQNYEEIKLVYSMPVSLAIAGGMAIGNYWNIILTNFNSEPQSYQDLIKINQVKYYF